STTRSTATRASSRSKPGATSVLNRRFVARLKVVPDAPARGRGPEPGDSWRSWAPPNARGRRGDDGARVAPATLAKRPLLRRSMATETYSLSVLHRLEAESVHVLREAAAEFERPVLMYSIGKDSSVLLRLAQKAFHPGKIPFPLLHIDTAYKFPEMYAFRDRTCAEIGVELRVLRNEAAIAADANPWDLGTVKCCGFLKTQGLLDALKAGNYDAVIGGARREEERSRAKERIYSFRDAHGQWDPRNQRPELWNLYNGRVHP